jgi:hypothetical protein
MRTDAIMVDAPASSGPPSAMSAVRVPGTPAHDAAQALIALSRASRSFTLYDAQNDAVKRLIADYRDKMQALAAHAPVSLRVEPFEIALDSEVVYREQDRERSLAFRLFRDGVRRVNIETGLSWEEMVQLLEVLSIRSTGVRQQEDDLITLLRKASFQRIVIESVEGFVPDEENPEAAPEQQARAEGGEPPDDWDLPLPRPEAGGAVEWRVVAPSEIGALRAEEAPGAFVGVTVRAVKEMLVLARELGDPKLRDDIVPFAGEVQEYLLVERSLDELAALTKTLRQAFSDDPARMPPLPGTADGKAFERLLRAVPDDATSAPAGLLELLAIVPGDHLQRAIDMLAGGAEGGRRVALLGIVELVGKLQPEVLLERIKTADAALAATLFAALGRVAPDRCGQAAHDMIGTADEALALQLIEILRREPVSLKLARSLQQLLGSASGPVRVAAAECLGQRGGARAVPILAEHLQRLSASGVANEEAAALGRALAQASAADAMPLFDKWARPAKGLLGLVARKPTQAQKTLAWGAVAGLEIMAGEQAGKLLEALAGHAGDDELERHTREAIARRKEAGRG